MTILLDTHVALWWLSDPERLEGEALSAIREPGNMLFLSAAAVWEVVIKAASGRMPPPPGHFEAAAAQAGLAELPIGWRHCRRAASLPPLHRDPFDRIMVAQAQEEGMVIATRDPLIRQYSVAVLPA